MILWCGWKKKQKDRRQQPAKSGDNRQKAAKNDVFKVFTLQEDTQNEMGMDMSTYIEKLQREEDIKSCPAAKSNPRLADFLALKSNFSVAKAISVLKAADESEDSSSASSHQSSMEQNTSTPTEWDQLDANAIFERRERESGYHEMGSGRERR